MYAQIKESLECVRTKNPLIVNITNTVTMDFIANGLLSLGASPVMTAATEELHDLFLIASGLVINIGTLNEAFVALVTDACSAANRVHLPITLDPVGAGASHYRTKSCLHLLERFKFSIIRGNASEIMALAGQSHTTKGVDSLAETEMALESAQLLSSQYPGTIVVVSGATDILVDGTLVLRADRGTPLMAKVTGSGCLLSAIMSAFDVSVANRQEAAFSALLFYSICGELAAKKSLAPASFKMHFLDALSMPFLPEHYDGPA